MQQFNDDLWYAYDCERCMIVMEIMTILAKSATLIHWGRDKIDAISQTIFPNAFSWMKMFEFRLKFHWS